jgi:hypothetical protein
MRSSGVGVPFPLFLRKDRMILDLAVGLEGAAVQRPHRKDLDQVDE